MMAVPLSVGSIAWSLPRSTVMTLSSLCFLLPLNLSADTQRGRALYENHCLQCHTDAIHNRKDSKVGNRESLYAWITAWSTHAGLNWTAEDIEDTARFMNQRYYRFSEPQKTQ